MFSRRQTKECGIGISFGKTLKVSGFNDQGKRRVRADTKKTAQLLSILLITCLGSAPFDPFIVTFDLSFRKMLGDLEFRTILAECRQPYSPASRAMLSGHTGT